MNQYKYKALNLVGIVSVAVTLTLSGGFASIAQAEDTAEIKQVRAGISKILDGGQPDSINPSVIDGLYEVMIGPQLYYVSKDGKYLLNGKLFDIDKRQDLTSPKIAKVNAKAIEEVGEDNMVIFAPTIIIFTTSIPVWIPLVAARSAFILL